MPKAARPASWTHSPCARPKSSPSTTTADTTATTLPLPNGRFGTNTRTSPLRRSPRKNSSSMAGANTTVAMAMTRNPTPWALPVSRCVGPLKFLMWLWNGRYIRTTMNCPANPMGMPIRSMSRKRRPRSRTKFLVPCVRLASQGAPMRPTHSPSKVDTTYHSGGTASVEMAREV